MQSWVLDLCFHSNIYPDLNVLFLCISGCLITLKLKLFFSLVHHFWKILPEFHLPLSHSIPCCKVFCTSQSIPIFTTMNSSSILKVCHHTLCSFFSDNLRTCWAPGSLINPVRLCWVSLFGERNGFCTDLQIFLFQSAVLFMWGPSFSWLLSLFANPFKDSYRRTFGNPCMLINLTSYTYCSWLHR